MLTPIKAIPAATLLILTLSCCAPAMPTQATESPDLHVNAVICPAPPPPPSEPCDSVWYDIPLKASELNAIDREFAAPSPSNADRELIEAKTEMYSRIKMAERKACHELNCYSVAFLSARERIKGTAFYITSVGYQEHESTDLYIEKDGGFRMANGNYPAEDGKYKVQCFGATGEYTDAAIYSLSDLRQKYIRRSP